MQNQNRIMNNYRHLFRKYGMDNPDTWKGDIRPTLVNMFVGLLAGTEYNFKLNKTDSSAKILEIHKEGENGRIIGISGLRNMTLWMFFNPQLYKQLRVKIDIPENQLPNRSQPHVRITLEKVWNILCVLTNKDECRTDLNEDYSREKVVKSKVIQELKAEDVKHNVIIIKINKLYREGMPATELYEVTRGVWKISLKRAEQADYALAVCNGIVKQVYHIDSWHPAGTTKYYTREINSEHCIGRIEFIGEVASPKVRNAYLEKSVATLFKKGEVNPVKVISRYSNLVEKVEKIEQNQEVNKRLEEWNTVLNKEPSVSDLERYFENEGYEVIGNLHPNKNVIWLKRKKDGKLLVGKKYKQYNKSVFQRLCDLKISGIPRYYSCEEMEDGLITIEDYIEGRDLNSILEDRGLFKEKDVVKIALKLCNTLEKLHSLEPPMIHRDIKPSNIIWTVKGDVVLIDFNATKEFHEGNTQDTVLLGTHFFAAPEQLLGYGASDNRTDIFGLGATMNFLLTKLPPKKYLVSGALGKVIEKCTEMSMRDRYTSVTELKQAIIGVKAD